MTELKKTLGFTLLAITIAVSLLSSAILINADENDLQGNIPSNVVAEDSNNIINPNNNTIQDLRDVEVLGLAGGQLLVWNTANQTWQYVDDSQPVSILIDLNNVIFAGLSNGNIMQYNSSSGKWENTQLIMSVEEVIDAYNNMAYKSGWDGSIVALINSWGNSTTLMNPQQPYSYLIYTDKDGNYCAKNGTDGNISFKSTDASYVISQACAQGEGIVLIKRGTYAGKALNLSHLNVRLVGEGQGTVLEFTEGITISNTSESFHQEISNLKLLGTGYNSNGLTLSATSRFVSYNLVVQNYDIGVNIQSSTLGATIFNNFYSLISYDNNIGVYIKREINENTVAHNTFYAGSIVSNQKWGVVIRGSASNEIFEGVEIENNNYGQVQLITPASGAVPEGNTFSKCYFEPELSNATSPFVEFKSEFSPDTEPRGSIFIENKFAVVGDTNLTLPPSTVFVNNYITGAPVYFTINAAAPGCQVEGNINPMNVVRVNYVGTGNTGRIMQYSKTNLASSGSWINFGATFPAKPVVHLSVEQKSVIIYAWPHQVETTRFYLSMFYSNGTEVTTPQSVMWTATLNLP